jgi:hypothetical protein
MIPFTDAQIATLRELAAPLAPWQRREFLEIVAERLANVEIGDGSVHAAALAARREVLTRKADDPITRLEFAKGKIDRVFGRGFPVGEPGASIGHGEPPRPR